ncbi:MAG: YHS domain-containing protein [Rhodanobacter sp.]|nr:MAG: YHS domain-containing protein [Rhodanobacter sp.]TAM01689.1 MAG: YHS domain-containing protein [Rhodanobacter sp.]TAM42164.1 MAG: YHS domain-containing protein [Rhodanobacter sp.]TAN26765.1 MAG: YHS domain-containing protein [Rhodanobacter sp.]
MDTLLYFVLWGGLFFLLMRFGCGSHIMGHGHGHAGEHAKPGTSNDTLRWTPPPTDVDPVCGKTVRTDGAKSTVHDGMVYYFCSGWSRASPTAGTSP